MVSFGEFLAEAYRRPSNVDWCETNHAYSEWVAEMGNTLSSVPMCGVAFYGLYRARRHLRWESRWFWAWFMLAIVGVGSALFHATLRHVFQAADELPMLYCNLCFAYLMIEERASFPGADVSANKTLRPSRKRWLAPLLVAAGAIQTYFYFAYPSVYEVFMVSYVVVVLWLVYRSVRLAWFSPDATKLQRLLVRIAFAVLRRRSRALDIRKRRVRRQGTRVGTSPGRRGVVDAGGAPARGVARGRVPRDVSFHRVLRGAERRSCRREGERGRRWVVTTVRHARVQTSREEDETRVNADGRGGRVTRTRAVFGERARRRRRHLRRGKSTPPRTGSRRGRRTTPQSATSLYYVIFIGRLVVQRDTPPRRPTRSRLGLFTTVSRLTARRSKRRRAAFSVPCAILRPRSNPKAACSNPNGADAYASSPSKTTSVSSVVKAGARVRVSSSFGSGGGDAVSGDGGGTTRVPPTPFAPVAFRTAARASRLTFSNLAASFARREASPSSAMRLARLVARKRPLAPRNRLTAVASCNPDDNQPTAHRGGSRRHQRGLRRSRPPSALS